MLARKMAKKDNEDKPRATIFTVFSETQEVATTVAAQTNFPPASKKRNNAQGTRGR